MSLEGTAEGNRVRLTMFETLPKHSRVDSVHIVDSSHPGAGLHGLLAQLEPDLVDVLQHEAGFGELGDLTKQR